MMTSEGIGGLKWLPSRRRYLSLGAPFSSCMLKELEGQISVPFKPAKTSTCVILEKMFRGTITNRNEVHTLNGIVVEVKLLQLRVEQGNSAQLVMGQMQIQQRAHVEYQLWKTFVAKLVVVKSHKGQVCKILKVILLNLLNVISVQEQLEEALRYINRHLPEDVVGQVELNQVLQIFEDVLAQAAVADPVVMQIEKCEMFHLAECSWRDLWYLVAA